MNKMIEMKNGTFTYNNESYNFDFKTSLSVYDKMVFVKTVVDNVVDGNSYDYIIKDLIFDFAIIDMFTNIDTSFINEKDEDGNEIHPIILIEHFLNETNIVDIVKANMTFGLLDELVHVVDLGIQYRTGIHTNPIGDAVASLISTLEKKVNEVDLDSMMSMAQKFAGMTEDFTMENLVNTYKNLSETTELKN
jgi:hypothetical protein